MIVRAPALFKCGFAIVMLIVTSIGTAHAQYVSYYGSQPEPLYPYVAQPQYANPPQQYAPSGYPYVRSVPPAIAPRASRTDPALIEELRKGRRKHKKETAELEKKQVKIDKEIIVREKPVVRKHIRIVDEPPIIVQREIDESQLKPAPPPRTERPIAARVIHAEAEVTILGPDRMSIRLYRKQDGRDANARAAATQSKKAKASASRKAEPQT